MENIKFNIYLSFHKKFILFFYADIDKNMTIDKNGIFRRRLNTHGSYYSQFTSYEEI